MVQLISHEPNSVWGSASLQPTAPSQAKPRVALPGLNVAPRAEGRQPACSPVQRLSIAVAAASAVGATGGEEASAAFDSFHKWSLTVRGGL